MQSVKTLLFVSAVLLFGRANAAGIPVWLPTSETVQAITIEIIGLDDGVDFAIFDDTDLGAFANPLLLNTPAGSATVNTSDNGNGTWHFEDAANALNWLTISDGSFIFALTGNGGVSWSATASSWLQTSANTWRIEYPGTTAAINLIAVDVKPIPVPAAVWLFGTGLVGLFAIARRRG